MAAEIARRLNGFQTALELLRLPEFQSVWVDRQPLAFSARVAEAEAAAARLFALVRQAEQSRVMLEEQAGVEEAELEQEACLIGHSLALWLTDRNDHRNADKIDGSLNQWRRLTGEILIEAARLIYRIGEASLADGHAATLAEYGVTTASLEKLRDETEDYAAVLVAPDPSAECRVSQQLRQRLNELERLFESLTTLIQHFRSAPGGNSLLQAWMTIAERMDGRNGHMGCGLTNAHARLVNIGVC